MPRSFLPPRGIFVSTRLLFDLHLSPTLKETLLQLMALSWGNDSHITPPLSLTLLEHLTGKDARTLRGHLAALRNHYAALRLQRAEGGLFHAVLAPWLFRSDLARQQASDSPPLPDLPAHLLPAGAANPRGGQRAPDARGRAGARGRRAEQDGGSLPEGGSTGGGRLLPQHDQSVIDHDDDQDQEMEWIFDTNSQDDSIHLDSGRGRQSPPRRQSPPGRQTPPGRALSGQMQGELKAAGVFGALIPEIADSAYSEDELRALLAWSLNDHPEIGAAVFINRLRLGAHAPKEYNRPACKRCGRHGKHAPECTERYVMTNYTTG